MTDVPTPAELDAMTYDEALAFTQRVLEELPPDEDPSIFIEGFEMLLYQKRTGRPGILVGVEN